MRLTDEDIVSFQKLYKKEFGKDIDRAEALQQATALVGLLKRVYKPMTKAEYIKTINMMRADFAREELENSKSNK